MNEINWQLYLEKAALLFWELINSNFFAALVGAGVGAFIAHQNLNRARIRQEISEEINNTNGAITIVANICHSAISTKKNVIKPLCDSYLNAKVTYEKNIKNNEFHSENSHVDLRVFNLPMMPIEELRSQLIGKVSLDFQAMSLIFNILDTHNSLISTVDAREKFIESFRSNKELSRKDQGNYLFSLEMSDSIHDTTMVETTLGIEMLIEDLIFFSHEAHTKLVMHAESLVAKYLSEFGKTSHKINRCDFSKHIESNDIPTKLSRYIKYSDPVEIEEKIKEYFKKQRELNGQSS